MGERSESYLSCASRAEVARGWQPRAPVRTIAESPGQCLGARNRGESHSPGAKRARQWVFFQHQYEALNLSNTCRDKVVGS